MLGSAQFAVLFLAFNWWVSMQARGRVYHDVHLAGAPGRRGLRRAGRPRRAVTRDFAAARLNSWGMVAASQAQIGPLIRMSRTWTPSARRQPTARLRSAQKRVDCRPRVE
jgi:hypothetical protein